MPLSSSASGRSGKRGGCSDLCVSGRLSSQLSLRMSMQLNASAAALQVKNDKVEEHPMCDFPAGWY